MSLGWRLRHLVTRSADFSRYPVSEFRFGVPCKVPLSAYEERYGRPITDDGGRFRLSLLRGLGFSGNPFTPSYRRLNGLYADAEYGFALEWCVPGLLREDRVAVAMTTFDRELYDDGWWAVVRQLQGVKWRREFLHGTRWERMLLHVVEDWARAQKCTAVACIRGQDSRWLVHGSPQAFRMRYDVSARRSGFRYRDAVHLWHKPLVSASA